MYKKYLLLIIIINSFLFCINSEKNLKNTIQELESKQNIVFNDKLNLAYLYIYAGDFKKSYNTFSDLYKLQQDAYLLFYKAFTCSIINKTTAVILWQEYLKLPEEESDGPFWRDCGKFVLSTLKADRFEWDKYQQYIKKFLIGKGYYTAICFLELYKNNNSDHDLLINKIYAKIYYYSNFYNYSSEICKNIYIETGEKYYLYWLAKNTYKLQDYSTTINLLNAITNDHIITKNKEKFYAEYMKSRSYHYSGDNLNAELYFNQAQKMAYGQAEKNLMDKLRLVVFNSNSTGSD